MARYAHLPIWKDAAIVPVGASGKGGAPFPAKTLLTLTQETRVFGSFNEFASAARPRSSIEYRATDLPGLRRRWERQDIAHALVAQDGHFKTSFKRRALRLF